MNSLLVFAGGALLTLAEPCSSAVTYYLSQPYYGRSDSPFYQGIIQGTLYVEDFEDRALNTPYVSAPYGDVTLDSGDTTVDEDDGKDGMGIRGYFWTRSRGARPPAGIGLQFDFDRNEAGLLPEYFGAALLKGNPTSAGPDFYSTILVYDAFGEEITGGLWQILQPRRPSNETVFSSNQDRLAGIHVPGGISKVVFMSDGIVDHLQYGYTIPESGTTFLAAAACLTPFFSRRRGRNFERQIAVT